MSAHLIDEVRAALAQLASHDLPGLPVYVLSMSDLPGDLRCSALGYTAGGLDKVLHGRGLLDWQGRGPAIVLDAVAGLGELPRTVCPADVVLALGLHELAHVIAEPWRYITPTPEAGSNEAQFLELVLARSLKEPEAPASSAAEDSHGARWLRALGHLVHRAEQASLARTGIVRWAVWGDCHELALPPFDSVLRSLEVEALANLNQPLRGLLDRPAPAEFVNLFGEVIR